MRRLIFLLSEYSSATISSTSWPLNFRDIYGVSPFVVIGARLRDEPDIEAIVSNRLPVHEAPSFYIIPLSLLQAKETCEAGTWISVSDDGGTILRAAADLTGLTLTEAPTRREEIGLRVGRQFTELRTDVTKHPCRA